MLPVLSARRNGAVACRKGTLLASVRVRLLCVALALVLGGAGAFGGPGAAAGELGPEASSPPDLQAPARPSPEPPARAEPSVPAAPSAPAGPSAQPSPSIPADPAPRAAPAVDLRQFVGSVVQIRTTAVRDGETVASLGLRRSGSGVIIGPSTVLTIGYLLLEADEVEVVTASGRRIPASVAAQDPASGFGIVRTALPLDGEPLALGDSDALAEGAKVLTLGHGEPIATELVVLSRKPFAGSWEYLLEKPLFTFPPVNNWSGAALISSDGRLVGIGSLIVNDAAPPGRNAVPGNLFVPVGLLAPILEGMLAEGKRPGPARPWLGVSTESVRGNLMVGRVTPGGPAQQAGLAPGDVIVGVGDEPVDGQADFYRKLWKAGPAGAEIPLRVLKGGAIRELKVRSIDREDFLRKPHGV
jgi:S1-C subfamily serine protease